MPARRSPQPRPRPADLEAVGAVPAVEQSEHRRDGPAPGGRRDDRGLAPTPAVPAAVVVDGAYRREADGRWRRTIDGAEVPDARDLTLAELFDPPVGELDGEAVRLVPRVWASRHPDHPLAWTFEHAELGGSGPIAVPVGAWAARAGQVVAMSSGALHPRNLVGVDGVAAIIGVAEPTVRAYLARRQIPEPIVRIGRTPVWSRHQIEAWQAARTRARPPASVSRPAPGPIESEDTPGDRGG